jgi:hypothetical protein
MRLGEEERRSSTAQTDQPLAAPSTIAAATATSVTSPLASPLLLMALLECCESGPVMAAREDRHCKSILPGGGSGECCTVSAFHDHFVETGDLDINEQGASRSRGRQSSARSTWARASASCRRRSASRTRGNCCATLAPTAARQLGCAYSLLSSTSLGRCTATSMTGRFVPGLTSSSRSSLAVMAKPSRGCVLT